MEPPLGSLIRPGRLAGRPRECDGLRVEIKLHLGGFTCPGGLGGLAGWLRRQSRLRPGTHGGLSPCGKKMPVGVEKKCLLVGVVEIKPSTRGRQKGAREEAPRGPCGTPEVGLSGRVSAVGGLRTRATDGKGRKISKCSCRNLKTSYLSRRKVGAIYMRSSRRESGHDLAGPAAGSARVSPRRLRLDDGASAISRLRGSWASSKRSWQGDERGSERGYVAARLEMLLARRSCGFASCKTMREQRLEENDLVGSEDLDEEAVGPARSAAR